MNENLVITWTPILKELPDEQRERARELIEKYGEANPTSFIVELLEIFGVHANYLQTVPAQIRIAGERAKADVRQSMDAVTTLHERTRLELNEIVSSVTRSGARFAQALETAASAHSQATNNGAKAIQTTIGEEFGKLNLPTLMDLLRDIQSKSERSFKETQRIHEEAERFDEYAKHRLATSEQLCKESVANIENLNWAGAWAVSILSSIALLVVGGCFMYGLLRSHSEKILADKIGLASATIQENRDAFTELAVAGVSLKVHRTSDPQTGRVVPGEFAILVENAEAAEMRDYGNGKAGFVFVKGPTPEEELHHLEVRLANALNQIRAGKQ